MPILNRLLTQAVSHRQAGAHRKPNPGHRAPVSISSAAVELAQLKVGQARGLDELVSLGPGNRLRWWERSMARHAAHIAVEGLQGPGLVNRTVSAPKKALARRFPEAAGAMPAALSDPDHSA